jgi:hypothetical protein
VDLSAASALQASIYEAIEGCLGHLRSTAGIDSMPAVSVV